MSENTQNQTEASAEDPEMNPNPDNETLGSTETTDTAATEETRGEIDETAALKAELAEMKDKYLRLYADFENFRRRTAREKIDMIANANAELMKALLPIADDFERAMQSFESTTELEPLKEGVELVSHKFFKTLEGQGLKPMASKGEVFDAELHESVTQFPAPTEDLKGKVIDEIEKGYFLNDKVLRYAKVVVGA